jgi:hypothetical protein
MMVFQVAEAITACMSAALNMWGNTCILMLMRLDTPLQEGEVKLLDTPAGALPAQGGLHSAAAAGTGAAVPLLPRSRRATADETLLRLHQYAPGSGSSGSSSSGSAAGSRALIRQLSQQQHASGGQNGQQLQWQGNRLWTADAAAGSALSGSGSRMSGSGALAAAPVLPSAGGLSALGFSRVQQASAPLAVLGPGSLLGENVLGYDAEQVRSSP